MNAPVDSAADRDRADERGASAKGKERAEPGPPPPAPDGPPRPPAKVAPPPPQSVSEPVKKSQPVVSVGY